MTTVASDGVAFLVHWLTILLLLVQAVTSGLGPPDDQSQLGVPTGLI